MEAVQKHTDSSYRDLPLSQLQESPTNPRSRYNEAALQELAGSIQAQGLLAPLLVRQLEPDHFALVAEAGSCHECSKRTGANALLFPESQRDSCLDRQCFQAKINAHIARSLEKNPELVQISTSWNGNRNGGPLSRNRYVEVVVAKPNKKAKDQVMPAHKKCPHLSGGLVVDGGNRGQVLTICAEPTCPVHHAESQTARVAQEKMRAEQRKQEERKKEDFAVRQRILDASLQKVSAPTKPDLELIANEFFGHLSQEYRTLMFQQLKLEVKDKPSAKEPVLVFESKVRTFDETALSRALIGMALLDATYNTFSAKGAERLEAVAKRYRVGTDKIREAVHAEFADKRKKQEQRRTDRGSGKQTTRRTPSRRTKP